MTGRSERSRSDDALRFLARHKSMLIGYIHAIVGDYDLCEDVYAEMMVAVSRKADQLDLDRPLGPLFRSMARNLSLYELRKRSRGPVVVDPAILDTVSSEIDEYDQEEFMERRKHALRLCLEKLPDARRRLIDLRYFSGLSYDRIAGLLDQSRNTLYVRVHQTHAILSECVRHQLNTGAV
jgi:RNA polymerase sigma-70 factor (ECF subfamily)